MAQSPSEVQLPKRQVKIPQLQVRGVIWRVNIGSCKPVAALWDSSDHGKWGGESRFCCTGKRVGRGNTIPPLFGAPVP